MNAWFDASAMLNSDKNYTGSGCGSHSLGLFCAFMESKPQHLRLPKRALFIRLDRIGDLVLTLPVDESFVGSEIHWWIPQGLGFVTNSAVPRRVATETSKKTTFTEFFKQLNAIRKQRYDFAVVFHGPWWVGCLLWLAGIPIRAGVKSQWHSFLFFNRAVRQKRSRAEHSELEYNYRLVETALRLPNGSLTRHHLKLSGQSDSASLLARHSLVTNNYSVVHPGMSGSALNWPAERYAELIRELASRETVAITGTSSDEPFLSPLRSMFANDSRVVWLDKKLNGTELITILANARTVTAPSTGVMHLAASTGTPTLGIFSPVRVQQPKRWGPQGPTVATVMPQVNCPGEMSCLGPTCPHYDCMKSISMAQASQALGSLSQKN